MTAKGNKPTLLATARTIEGIQRMVNLFWVSENYRVNPETLEITHATGHTVPAGAAIEQHKGLYRFVMRST